MRTTEVVRVGNVIISFARELELAKRCPKITLDEIVRESGIVSYGGLRISKTQDAGPVWTRDSTLQEFIAWVALHLKRKGMEGQCSKGFKGELVGAWSGGKDNVEQNSLGDKIEFYLSMLERHLNSRRESLAMLNSLVGAFLMAYALGAEAKDESASIEALVFEVVESMLVA
ncbi:hypothetical protein [Pseudomonas chlororaphis]|nr:hypothetical protein [Pseudomonas chlororaphis]